MRNKVPRYRSYKNFDADKFRKDLAQVPWSVCEVFGDPNDAWHAWKSMFTPILDEHAPFRTRRIKLVDSAPWITDEVLTAIQSRDDAHETALRFKTRDLWNTYKCARNHVTSLIRQTKSE